MNDSEKGEIRTDHNREGLLEGEGCKKTGMAIQFALMKILWVPVLCWVMQRMQRITRISVCLQGTWLTIDAQQWVRIHCWSTEEQESYSIHGQAGESAQPTE